MSKAMEDFIIEDIETLVCIDKRIDAIEVEGLRERWEFGRIMLAARNGKKRLPNGYLAALVKATGKSRTELGYRIQFAEKYPELSNALDSFTSWFEVTQNLADDAAMAKARELDAKYVASLENSDAALFRLVEPLREMRDRLGWKVLGFSSWDEYFHSLGLTEEAAELLRIAISEHDGPKPSKRHSAKREPQTPPSPTTEAQQVRAENRNDAAALIDWASLPGTAQQKLETAKRQIRKELQAEFESRVRAQVDAQLESARNSMRVMQEEAYKILQGRRGVFTRSEWSQILFVVHPDTGKDVSDEKRANAFRLLNEADILLLNEANRPTTLPASSADLKRKQPKRY
jgi:hypothetical protein